MKKILTWALVLPLTASVMLSSCKKDDDDIPTTPTPVNNPVKGKTLIGKATSDSAEIDIRVYADEALFVGYNKIYVMLYEKGSDKQIMKAEVSYDPMMSMSGGMNHSCPIENPDMTAPKDGLFEGAIVFVMPTTAMDGWTLGIRVHNLVNSKEGSAEMSVTVIEPTDARMYSFVSPVDSKKIFISMLEPAKPEVGMNDFVVTAHFKESAMNWPALEDLHIEFEPYMPTMGHGSPNNVNPVHMKDGHYQGVANFTMSGLWQLFMTIKDNQDVVLDDANSFYLNF